MIGMRAVKAHALEGELGDMNIKVVAHELFGPGCSTPHYSIGEAGTHGILRWLAQVDFQAGNPAEVGVTGITLEALLAVCYDRLECFQAGPHANAYNAEALQHIERALEALKDRTRERDLAQ